MFEYLKKSSKGFFILIVAFSYSIYFIVSTLLGLPQEGVIFRIYSGALALITVGIFFLGIHYIPSRFAIGGLLLCAIVTLLYFSTQFFYVSVSKHYSSYFLSMGVRFIPSILIGLYMLSDDNVMDNIERALFPFILLYTLTLASVAFTANIGVNVNETFNTDFLNYQNISYYSIFAFGFTMYLIEHRWRSYSMHIKYALVVLAIIQVLIAIMAGGRGAFVLGCVFVVYYALKHISISGILVYALIGIVALYAINVVLSSNEIFQLGFSRIFNFFSDPTAISSDDRWIRWNLAWESFLESPIFGHGLGSVFYEVGFYSHNIFTDMLCEGGVVLVLIYTYLILTFARSSRLLVKEDFRNEIIIIIFLCSFVMYNFSGYYLSDTGSWIALTYTLCKYPLYNRSCA